VTVILLAALSGSTIHESYLMLIDMTVILTFIPLLYIFAALPVLRRRAVGGDHVIATVPGGTVGLWLTCGFGFAITLLAIVTSLLPPEHDTHPGLFFLKVGGGSCLLIGIGLAFYARGKGRLADEPATQAA
jgi:amino acid transporter